MSSRTVEERLRAVIAYLNAVKHVAMVMDEYLPVARMEQPQQFAEWVIAMSDLAATQVEAIQAALPQSCTNQDAPLADPSMRY